MRNPRKSARSSLFSRADRAENRREYAAALDVGDEDPRRVDTGGECEVGQVPPAQVELAHAACSFNDHEIEAARQVRVRRQHLVEQIVRVFVIPACGKRLPDRAVDDHLARTVAVRLEQDRIHRALGLEAARFGLRHLGPPDLAPVATRDTSCSTCSAP